MFNEIEELLLFQEELKLTVEVLIQIIVLLEIEHRQIEENLLLIKLKLRKELKLLEKLKTNVALLKRPQ